MTTPSPEHVGAVPGLTYWPNFITPEEHHRLMAFIDSQPWLTSLKRRVQHYGYRYDYKRRRIDPSLYLGHLPPLLASLAERLHHESGFEAVPDQAIVNEYEHGQGITRHVDCVPCFGPSIGSLSLNSTCVMEFSRPGVTVPVLLEPCSLVILRGPARDLWCHAIPARKSDNYGGRILRRSRRISLTFRTVRL